MVRGNTACPSSDDIFNTVNMTRAIDHAATWEPKCCPELKFQSTNNSGVSCVEILRHQIVYGLQVKLENQTRCILT